jgi:lipopolysaccharide transport system permease protein
MIEGLRQLYRYRVLIQVLIVRELKARYRRSALGFLWSFVNPLILTVIYLLVFTVYMRMDMERYSGFLLCGILAWVWLSSALQTAANCIIQNGGLIKKVYLPSEVFPFVSVGSNFVHYLFSVPILVGLLLLLGTRLSWPLLAFPVVVVLQFTFIYGLALIVSSLAVRFRDLLHVLPNLLLLWFFLTPIFYPVTAVPQKYRVLVEINPMFHIVKAYQDMFVYNAFPSVLSLLALMVLCGVLLSIGFSFFAARKGVFAEEI